MRSDPKRGEACLAPTAETAPAVEASRGERPTRPAVDLEAEATLARCGALKDHWYVACLATELPRGEPIGREVLGVPLVLFRDERGAARALRDRCLHRHARLSAGVVLDGRLCCPYHGWTYDGAGRCVEVPSLGPAQRGQVLDAAGHARAGLCVAPCDVGRVEAFPALEQDGLVYVFMGGDPARARSPAWRVPHHGEPGWTTYFMVTHFPNGVTNLVENFMDVPHTVFVHKGWFRNTARRRVPATVERRNGGEVLVTYHQQGDVVAGLGRVFNPHGEPMTHTDHFFAPNITRVDYTFGAGRSGFVINSQCTPVGPTSTWVYTAISYRLPYDLPGALVARALRPLVCWYTKQVIRQDVEIMGVQREGLTRGGLPIQFASTEADLLHADIEAYRAWLLAGAAGEPPADAAREIVFWI